ncbi:uncharacterized protein LOC113492234 [Trichoplusia ni]|uniref:Sucrose-6-phosphate hydrolase n=1 Tax=Trichoplusia ni TaxID=7111 RepID=A0A7E5VAV4_TRINI|nr:uncharacterized protein LOC113492234 [Trichoplusia ni]
MNLFKIYIILVSSFMTVQLESLRDVLAKAELEIYIEEKKLEINPRHKLHYHITPPVGWMNAPNGFVFFKGEYHVFYQFYPYDTQWGPMHWGHVTSRNLVDWRHQPTALLPGREQCFSGSVIDNDGILAVMYTAHQISVDPPYYNESQYMAFSIDGIDFHKYKNNPVIVSSPFSSPDFRDPKIWKHGNVWYTVIGSRTDDHRGAALLYRSINIINWEFVSTLAESNGELGFMWESPDFFELNGKHVLLISPQGIVAQGDRYKNTYQTGYIIGNFNYENFEFTAEATFQELDFGHDFYGTQTTEKDGKRYLIAWFGMWESAHSEDVDGWAGAMTLFRELDLVGTRIIMKPVDAITNLRMQTISEGELARNSSIQFEQTAELIINVDLSERIELELKGNGVGGDWAIVRWEVDEAKMVLDRAGDVRQVGWEPLDSMTWRLFLDTCSLELFCGEGEVVFSTRIYPNGQWRVKNLGPQPIHVVAYKLRRSFPE